MVDRGKEGERKIEERIKNRNNEKKNKIFKEKERNK